MLHSILIIYFNIKSTFINGMWTIAEFTGSEEAIRSSTVFTVGGGISTVTEHIQSTNI